MANATLYLSKKVNAQGEHPILVRVDVTRKNRPQFKSNIAILPEFFVDGEIKIPMRSKLNAQLRESLLKKKADIDAYVASLLAIAMALPEDARTRNDILEVYEMVKSVNPTEISRTTIIAKKREQNEANLELVRQLQESRRPDVLQYIRKRTEGMEKGTIKRKGNNYTKGTLHTYKGFVNVLEQFVKHHPFDWEDLNENLIDKFVLYLENYGYMKKTINKLLAVFSSMLNAAFKEGYTFKHSILDRFPKLNVTNDDKKVEIYLTEEELQALYEMRLKDEEKVARDIFLVGCYTSQRFSDYSRISERNISFHDGIGIITLIQKKTGTEVSIPILNDNLIKILKRYDYNLPTMSNVRLNLVIKGVFEKLSKKVPSLQKEMATKVTLTHLKNEEESKVKFKRNAQGEILLPRHQLVTTHTARRTGITLMYLSRVLDTHEMMSISGHKTESVFNDYIKISGIELATNIAKKVAKAKKESELKALLLKQFEDMSAEKLTKLLEVAKNEPT